MLRGRYFQISQALKIYYDNQKLKKKKKQISNLTLLMLICNHICECLVKLAITDKILKCLLTCFPILFELFDL